MNKLTNASYNTSLKSKIYPIQSCIPIILKQFSIGLQSQ